jgi:hypothetical protein
MDGDNWETSCTCSSTQVIIKEQQKRVEYSHVTDHMVMHCVRLLATLGKFKVQRQHHTKRNALFLRCKPAPCVMLLWLHVCCKKLILRQIFNARQSRQTEECNMQRANLTANVNKWKNISYGFPLLLPQILTPVTKLVEELRYNSEGGGSDPRWRHWNFSLTWSLRPRYGPGVDSASDRKECQEIFLGVKSGQCIGLTNLPPSSADGLEIWKPQPPGTLRACPGLYWDFFSKSN